MARILQIWNWISGIGVSNVPETEKRTIIVLNRINFFIVITGLFGFLSTLAILLIHGDKLFGIGSVRLFLMMGAGLLSFLFTALSFQHFAKILTSSVPIFLLVVLPTLLGNTSIEYYFYYPFACTASAIIPILLFPSPDDRKVLVLFLLYSFILTVTIDNLLTHFTYPGEAPSIFQERYFFFKLAQVLIFVFTVSIVLTLKITNTNYESILSQKNNELLIYKAQLEELVEKRTESLRESEIRFRTVFEAANDGILIMKDNLIIDCNTMATSMFGCPREYIIGKTPAYFSPPFQPDGSNSINSVSEKTRVTLSGVSQQFEWLHVNLDGRPLQTEVSLTRIDIRGQYFLLALIRDFTSRKMAEESLKNSESRFRSLVDSLTDYIYTVWVTSGKILETNHGEGCQSVTGYSSQEFLDNPGLWINIVPEDDRPLVIDHANLMLSGIKVSPMEHRILHKNGSVKWVRNTSVARFNDQGYIFAYDGLISDITDRKIAEENLREAEHKVMKAIITTEETERSRIAQDLHDGLGPVLSTIKLYFQVYLDTRDDTKKAELTEKLKNTIEEAIKGISEISHNISPHVLKNHGFYAAIRQFFHQIALTNVVKLNLDDGHEPVINETNGIILYRAITELVNNSIKHAKCKNIDISFREQNGVFLVDYSDDGKGFNEALSTEPHLGSGLQNVRNRIRSLYGVVDIKSTPGHGMSAMIKIPL